MKVSKPVLLPLRLQTEMLLVEGDFEWMTPAFGKVAADLILWRKTERRSPYTLVVRIVMLLVTDSVVETPE
jgi:hypothetical protein